MEIPGYPDTRALDFGDKALFDNIFNALQPQVSEMTFANLYLFRKVHYYRLSRLGGSIVVSGRGYDGRNYFLPPLGEGIAAALRRLFGDGLNLYGADEEFVKKYLSDDRHRADADRDSSDYLYLREELATLPGNRFHKKKNRINYFTARHTYHVDLMTAGDTAECRKLLSAWHYSIGKIRNSSAEMDFEACDEALVLMQELGLQGVLVRVNGTVRAFALGERLNDDTAVCHFEKADPFMEGLSQLINREFARRLFIECSYLNREQDLGEQGLRSAKLSYHPARLVTKYRVSPNPDV